MAYHGMQRLTPSMTLRSSHTASRSDSPSPSFVVTAKAHERAYPVDISGLALRSARQLRLQQPPSPDLRNGLYVERMGGVVAVSFLFLCLYPDFPHPLFFYPPAVPWSAIWPSLTHVPACCPGWPPMPTPDGALRAPPLARDSATSTAPGAAAADATTPAPTTTGAGGAGPDRASLTPRRAPTAAVTAAGPARKTTCPPPSPPSPSSVPSGVRGGSSTPPRTTNGPASSAEATERSAAVVPAGVTTTMGGDRGGVGGA